MLDEGVDVNITTRRAPQTVVTISGGHFLTSLERNSTYVGT